MTSLPVRVVIPAHNAGESLQRCLDAVSHLDPAPAEVVIVDDASSDDTPAIAAGFDMITIRRQVRGGPGVARNTGADGTRLPLLAFLDADCVPDPDWLGALVGGLRPHHAGVTGWYRGAADAGVMAELIEAHAALLHRGHEGTTGGALSANLLVRTADFNVVGGFPEYRLPWARHPQWGCEDAEFAAEVLAATGRGILWSDGLGPRHIHRRDLWAHLRQQHRYCDALVIAATRNPAMVKNRAQFNRSDGTVAALSTLGLVLPLARRRPWQRWAGPVLWAAIQGRKTSRMLMLPPSATLRSRLGGLTGPVVFGFVATTSAAWLAGLTSGAAKALIAGPARIRTPGRVSSRDQPSAGAKTSAHSLSDDSP